MIKKKSEKQIMLLNTIKELTNILKNKKAMNNINNIKLKNLTTTIIIKSYKS